MVVAVGVGLKHFLSSGDAGRSGGVRHCCRAWMGE